MLKFSHKKREETCQNLLKILSLYKAYSILSTTPLLHQFTVGIYGFILNYMLVKNMQKRRKFNVYKVLKEL